MTPPDRPARVVLGLGSCVDYEIRWDGAVLAELVERYRITPADLDRSTPIEDERDLVRSVVAFVRDGVGGERFVGSPDVLRSFAARFDYRPTLGGTNVRAAIAMSRLGLRSTLHLVSIDDTVRTLLPPEVDYVCSARHDSTWPHLIVQYPAGAEVPVGDGVVRARHANRLIYVNDLPNREMVLSPALGTLLADARIFLISGFNTVQDVGTLDARLAELRAHLRHLPADALVVFEDAGYHVPAHSARVIRALGDVVDVHGMNEDELQAHLGAEVDLLDPDALAAALVAVRRVVPAPTVLVHTRYWCLALGLRAARYREALESATRVAAARYLRGDAFTRADHDAVATTARHPGGLEVAARLEASLPGLVCCVAAFAPATDDPTTVGLGDAFVGGFVAGLVAVSRPTRRGTAAG